MGVDTTRSLAQHRAMQSTGRSAALGVVIAALAFGILLTPETGDACVMIMPAMVSPSGLAPTNTHVWIQGSQLPLGGGATYVLIASSAPNVPIPIELRAWERSSLAELVPLAPLAPHTRHEIWGTARRSSASGRPVTLPLGTFTTTGEADTVPPGAPTLREARLNVPLDSCWPWIGVMGEPLPAEEAVYYALHVGDASGKIVYDAPPAEIARWPLQRSVHLKPVLELTAPGKNTSFIGRRVGLRAIDLAGNLGPPVELVLER